MDQKIAKAAVILGSTYIAAHSAVAVVSWIKHRRAMKQIEARTVAEVARIRKAGKKVQEEIETGKYNETGLAGMMEDFAFYRQVADLEN